VSAIHQSRDFTVAGSLMSYATATSLLIRAEEVIEAFCPQTLRPCLGPFLAPSRRPTQEREYGWLSEGKLKLLDRSMKRLSTTERNP
jgi:hypothetical protein